MFKEHNEKCECMDDLCGEGLWSKEFEKEYKIALLKKKEQILEAKLNFVREINKLIEKSVEVAETVEPVKEAE